MNIQQRLSYFHSHCKELALLDGISALLGWDQQTYMPKGGADSRAQHREYISRLHHEKAIEPKFSEVVFELESDLPTLSESDQVNIRETAREIRRKQRLPVDFVAEQTRVTSLCQSAWEESKPKNNYEGLRPSLEKVFELLREETKLVGYKEHPYDAMLDVYESGLTLATVKPLLLDLAEQLSKRIPDLEERFRTVPELIGEFSQELQSKLGLKVAAALGYDLSKGRLDTAAHPFMTTISPGDQRITTRYHLESFLPSLYGVIHETGHALYEQGLMAEYAGLPLGRAASMGVHESQSRFYENMVARNRHFFNFLAPQIKNLFPEYNSNDLDLLSKQANKVRPSLLRVEADEVTYSVHIVIRMLLEEQLISGELAVRDLPSAWSESYQRYLGITPKTDTEGVMQDIHWHMGAVGYFPSYALGNIYGGMLHGALKAAIPDWDHQLESGKFGPTLEWLRTNIHNHGMRYQPAELIERASGQRLSAQPFLDYLDRKFATL